MYFKTITKFETQLTTKALLAPSHWELPLRRLLLLKSAELFQPIQLPSLRAVHCPFFILLKAICYIRWLADFFSSLKKTLLHTHLLSRWCIPHKDFLGLNRNRLVFIWKASNCSEKFRQGCFFWTFRARSFLGDFWDGFACIVWISANMVFGPPFINGRPQKTVSVCWKPFTPVFWSPFLIGCNFFSMASFLKGTLDMHCSALLGTAWHCSALPSLCC